jgi:transposase
MCMHDMTILAIDLGKTSGVWCLYQAISAEHRFGTVKMTRQAVHDLLEELQPKRLVIESGPAAGWVHDLAETLGLQVEVANANHEAWRWTHVKHKTDRRDALKLAQLSAVHQLPTVHMPSPAVRAWRSLIRYRRALVDRRTRIKNSIRAILHREAMDHPGSKRGWTKKALRELAALVSVDAEAVWCFELNVELRQLKQVEQDIIEVEKKLALIAQADERVKLLKTAPAVGDRLAETIVAVIDDPKRFKRGRDVGCYAGMTPRQFQSGAMDRQGRISGQGNGLLRSLLVEVSWLGVKRFKVPWMVGVYEQVRRGSEKRKKIAIVAVARRLLIRCWAMLRDGTPWREPEECVVSKLAA